MLVGRAAMASIAAHATPFTYIDIRADDGDLRVTLSAHVIDVAHDLGVASPDALLRPSSPDMRPLGRLLQSRANIRTDGRAAECEEPTAPTVVTPSSTIRWSYACVAPANTLTLSIDGPLFPYDPEHQTFVNVYVSGALAGQSTLDREHSSASFAIAANVRPSAWATWRRFLVAGIRHILQGPDHLLFLAGLLLLGGTIRRLTTIVTAFTVAHSVTLALAVLDLVTPPPRLIEPVIALSIVYVGIRNLRGSTGGEWRTLTAGAFGLIHGFGFAYALREMQLPRAVLGWSLFSFNLGVELGQLAVVLLMASLFAALRPSIGHRRLIVVGSWLVVAAGSFWFVERLVAL